MILVQCKNGIVAFRVVSTKPGLSQQVYCMNSDKLFTLKFGPSKVWLQGVQEIVAEAVRLQGALVSVNDIAELA